MYCTCICIFWYHTWKGYIFLFQIYFSYHIFFWFYSTYQEVALWEIYFLSYHNNRVSIPYLHDKANYEVRGDEIKHARFYTYGDEHFVRSNRCRDSTSRFIGQLSRINLYRMCVSNKTNYIATSLNKNVNILKANCVPQQFFIYIYILYFYYFLIINSANEAWINNSSKTNNLWYTLWCMIKKVNNL